MLNIFLVYLGIITYFLIGYYIHNQAIDIVVKNNYLKSLYNQLSVIFKVVLFCIIIVFWFPIIIGEMFLVLLNWFAKTYNDMN